MVLYRGLPNRFYASGLVAHKKQRSMLFTGRLTLLLPILLPVSIIEDWMSYLQNPISADKGATYAKMLSSNLSSLSPHVAGPNSVKVATPLADLEAQNTVSRTCC
jgi:hypothetical protein